MKKILSLLLVGIMVVSMVPTAFATTNYTNGTDVEYDAANDDTIGDINGDGQPDNTEYYTVTVPALMAPGASGNVVAQGTWASNRKLTVTADEDVTLTNSINAADQKVLDVTFPGIELAGSNTAAVSDTKAVSVAGIDNALFGTWSGTFYYDVEMVDNIELISFTINDYGDNKTYQARQNMTWGEWVESEYNTDNYVYKENEEAGPYGNDIQLENGYILCHYGCCTDKLEYIENFVYCPVEVNEIIIADHIYGNY